MMQFHQSKNTSFVIFLERQPNARQDLQLTYSDPLLLRNIELFLDSSLSVIFQYEWGLQMANEVTMPTPVTVLNSEDIAGEVVHTLLNCN